LLSSDSELSLLPFLRCPSQGKGPAFQYADLLKLVIFVIVCFVLFQFFDGSQLYHDIRGQNMMKLYVIYNMLEVLDRLCYSFGVDILESLFVRATESQQSGRGDPAPTPAPNTKGVRTKVADMFPISAHFLLALIYVGKRELSTLPLSAPRFMFLPPFCPVK